MVILVMTKYFSHSENDTARIAQEIAEIIDYPAILCLYGDLGAGKSVFSRAFIRHVLKDSTLTVPSPTYTFVQTYDDEAIWHFDLYRLETTDQLYDIGWEEALTAKLCLIEWPERLDNLKPKNTVDIIIKTLPDDAREITLKS